MNHERKPVNSNSGGGGCMVWTGIPNVYYWNYKMFTCWTNKNICKYYYTLMDFDNLCKCKVTTLRVSVSVMEGSWRDFLFILLNLCERKKESKFLHILFA